MRHGIKEVLSSSTLACGSQWGSSPKAYPRKDLHLCELVVVFENEPTRDRNSVVTHISVAANIENSINISATESSQLAKTT